MAPRRWLAKSAPRVAVCELPFVPTNDAPTCTSHNGGGSLAGSWAHAADVINRHARTAAAFVTVMKRPGCNPRAVRQLAVHPWHDYPVDASSIDRSFPTVIEVPMGSKNKYELDK